jgi:transcriptional regulator with XRE-family HTH domain
MKKLDSILSETFTAEQRAEIRRRAQEKIAGLRLAQIREVQQVTQQEAAQAMGVSQAALSKLERRPNVTVSALQRYVEALGGRLEVNVLLPSPQRRSGVSASARRTASRTPRVRRIPLVVA